MLVLESAVRLKILYFVLALPAGVSASDIRPMDVVDQSSPVFEVFTSGHGLSEEIWSTVGFDRQRFAWAGSASSLARFNGYRWQHWPVAEGGGLVRDMASDNDGNLWALVDGSGLARHDGGAWKIETSLPQAQRFIETFDRHGHRHLWLTYRHGLARLVDGRWMPDPGNGLDTVGAIALAQTERLMGRPLQWLARRDLGGLWHRDILASGEYGPWQRADVPSKHLRFLSGLLRSVSEDVEELWVLGYGVGLSRLTEHGLTSWHTFDPCSPGDVADCHARTLPSDAMYTAVATHDGAGKRHFWLATRAGLVRIRDDDQVSVYDRRHGLPSAAVRTVRLQHVDGIDLLWLATEGGVARAALTDNPWRTVSLFGAEENGIFGILLEPDGDGGQRLWIGSAQRGLARLEDGEWQYFQYEQGELPQRGIRALWRVEGPNGEPWRLVSFQEGGLYRIHDDDRFEALRGPWLDSDGSAVVNDVVVRHHQGQHEMWVATRGDGMHRLRAGQWQSFEHPDGEGGWGVRAILEQADESGGRWLWALGDAGLHRFDGKAWRRVSIAESGSTLSYLHGAFVTVGTQSELWLGTVENGVMRLDLSDPERLALIRDSRVPAPPDATIYSIHGDSQGRVYVCTNNGVQQLTPDDRGGFTQRVHRRADGLVHDECNFRGQFIDDLDRYWVGTLGGLSMFDPNVDETRARVEPRSLVVTSLIADQLHYEIEAKEAISLPSETREVRIEFALLPGLRERETLFRTELGGLDDKPGAWSPANSRHYAGLPPGSYTLNIEARDYSGTVTGPVRLAFDIAPKWWQRSGLQLASAALLVLVLGFGVRQHNLGLRRRKNRLEQVVTARTRQLQQANERLESLSFEDPLTGLANRRRLMLALGNELQRAREHGTSLGLIIVDVDLFKPYNDRYGHVAGDAALRAIAGALQQSVRAHEMVARLGGEEFACLIADADPDTVVAMAERMRCNVEALKPRDLGNDHESVTISAGVLTRVPLASDNLSTVLRDCDAALYEAKNAGRNCIRVYVPPLQS